MIARLMVSLSCWIKNSIYFAESNRQEDYGNYRRSQFEIPKFEINHNFFLDGLFYTFN